MLAEKVGMGRAPAPRDNQSERALDNLLGRVVALLGWAAAALAPMLVSVARG